MRREWRLSESYWLVMSVFLFYHHPICVLSSLTNQKDSPGTNSSNYSSTEAVTFDNSEYGQCPYGWQTYDGTECVCASNDTARCKDEGSFICDDTGATYPSTCQFSLDVCQQNIPFDRSIKSCGACDILKLRGEKTLGQKEIFFIREGKDRGYDTIYRSENGEKLDIFFDTVHQVWVIGRKDVNGSFAAMLQPSKFAYPQDSEGGMLIAVNTGSGVRLQPDLSLRLECYNANFKQNIRKKRLAFLVALAFVGVAATGTATTLKIVQAKQGCLYYPKVCRLRDEIKNKLKPEVMRLRRTFNFRYRNTNGMKSLVEDIQEQILDVRESLITIRKLYSKLEFSLSGLTEHLGNLQTEFPKFGDLLKSYKDWIKNLKLEAVLSFLGLEIEIALTAATLPSLIAAGTSAFGLALAGIGAVLAIGFAVVDIVSSIKQEEKVKKDLERAKESLVKSRSDLQAAFRNMKEFQKKFCQTVIDFLRILSGKGKRYHRSFARLHGIIISVYGNSKSKCNQERYFSRTNYRVLLRLKNSVKSLLAYLSKNISSLQKKILEVDQMDEFIKHIKRKIQKDKKKPTDLFNFVKTHKPSLAKQLFQSLFSFVKYISKDVLAKTKCYWGYNLEGFRNGVVTEQNYLMAPICSSPEMTAIDTNIRNAVAGNKIPCEIVRQVKGPLFRNKYLVLRYIADFILPSSNCYWGYDLTSIRTKSNIHEVDKANMKSTLFSTLHHFKSNAIDESIIGIARKIICSETNICNEKWQTFILCAAWRGHSVTVTLKCSVSDDSKCIPDTKVYQACS